MLLENVYTVYQEFSDGMAIRQTIWGIVRFPKAMFKKISEDPSGTVSGVIPRPPEGFKREDIKVSLSNDGSSIEYSVHDVRRLVRPDGDTLPFP